MISSESLSVKIFADGANKDEMLRMNANPLIQGLTTNPTLMKKAGVVSYTDFAKEILSQIKTKPISFEVFSDDLESMKKEALEIASWGSNVYVKIPVTNTLGNSTGALIKELTSVGVKVNVTAIMTERQVQDVSNNLNPEVASYISVFAGRVADTGIDPIPLMKNSLNIMRENSASELIWASPREVFNVVQASQIGCHVITVTSDIFAKLDTIGYDLSLFSLDTVKMFYRDALAAGYKVV